MRRLLFDTRTGVTALALTAPAHAQSPGWRDQDRPYPAAQESFYNSGRIAYDNGFREGLKARREGRRKKATASRFQDERTFQHADKGYHREYGPLDRYRQSFRTGYPTGYSDGYQRYARITATETAAQ